MSNFERDILGGYGIPFNVAADFFIGIRQAHADDSKLASMADAPDETGELEGRFEVPVENVAALLQNVVTHAVALQGASQVYENSVRGPNRFQFNNWGYQDIIRRLSARAAVLGGPVHIGDIPPPPATTDPASAVRSLIRGEQELVHALNELRTVCGNNPLGHTALCMASEAQQRMDDMWRFLDPVAPQMHMPMQPVGLQEHEATEDPVTEGEESPEFEAAEEAAGVEPPGHAEMKQAASIAKAPGALGRAGQLLTGSRAKGLSAAVERNSARAKRTMDQIPGYDPKRVDRVFSKATSRAGSLQKALEDEERKVFHSRLAAAGAAGGLLYGMSGKSSGEKRAAREKEEETEETARHKGRLSGETQAEKNRVVDHKSRGERYGKAVGSLAGAVGGAAAGKKYLGGTSGAALGAAAGYLGAGGLGKELGRSHDIGRDADKEKKASALFKAAMRKLAFGEEGQMSSPTDTQALQPSNYLQAEILGQQAQEQQESAFYKQQLQMSQQNIAAMQQQMSEVGMQLQQLQQQAAMSGQQIEQSTQQAVAAQDEALKQTQIAANMRMGMQKLRAQMLEVASQDPADVAAQEMQAQAQQAQMQQEQAAAQEQQGAQQEAQQSTMQQQLAQLAQQPGKPGEQAREAQRAQFDADQQLQQAFVTSGLDPSASAQLPPGAAAPNGGTGDGSGMDVQTASSGGAVDPSMAAPASVYKTAASGEAIGRLAGGAVAGLGAMYMARDKGQRVPEFQAKVEELEGRPNSFVNALRVVAAKGNLAEAQLQQKHPNMGMLWQGAKGAAIGQALGGMVGGDIEHIRKLYNSGKV